MLNVISMGTTRTLAIECTEKEIRKECKAFDYQKESTKGERQ